MAGVCACARGCVAPLHAVIWMGRSLCNLAWCCCLMPPSVSYLWGCIQILSCFYVHIVPSLSAAWSLQSGPVCRQSSSHLGSRRWEVMEGWSTAGDSTQRFTVWVTLVLCCPSVSRTVLPCAGLLLRRSVWSGADYITQNPQLHARLARGTFLFDICKTMP